MATPSASLITPNPGIHYDPTAPAAQAQIIAQIRALLAAVPNVILSDVVVVIKDLTGIDLSGWIPFIDALGAQIGVDLTNLPGFVDNLIIVMVNTVLGAIGNLIPFAAVLGDPIATFSNAVLAIVMNALGLGSHLNSLQSQVNTPVAIPIQQSAHNGEASVTWENCNTDITVQPTAAYGAFIRTAAPDQKTTVTFHAYKAAGVTAVNLDLIKLDPTTGTATLKYSSADVSGSIPTGAYAPVVVTIPAASAIITSGNDYWGWQITPVGGNLTVRGFTDTNPALPTRPMRRGFTFAARPGATISQSAMDAAYSVYIPYIEFNHTVSVVTAPLIFYDDFHRPIL